MSAGPSAKPRPVGAACGRKTLDRGVSGRGEEYRHHALGRMRQAGAQITNHESVGFEWARTKEHERFRALNQLLREGQLT